MTYNMPFRGVSLVLVLRLTLPYVVRIGWLDRFWVLLERYRIFLFRLKLIFFVEEVVGS